MGKVTDGTLKSVARGHLEAGILRAEEARADAEDAMRAMRGLAHGDLLSSLVNAANHTNAAVNSLRRALLELDHSKP